MARGAAADHPETPRSGKKRKKAQHKSPQRDPAGEHKASPTLAEDEERSEWEGMAVRPEQPSDDVATPGHLPEDHP